MFVHIVSPISRGCIGIVGKILICDKVKPLSLNRAGTSYVEKEFYPPL